MSNFQVNNITVRTEEKEIVHDVSFSVTSSEIVVLTGANGSGKSSLVNALFGHPKYEIVSGSIHLDNEDLTHLSPDKKAKMGLFLSLQHVPEIDGVTFSSFLFRAYKELKNIPDLSVMDFQSILREKAEAFGLPMDFFKRGVNIGLSGGEKKQVEAFQLALFEPRFAFLDEIDSGADESTREKVFRTVNELKEKGTGFLLITHHPNIHEKVFLDRTYAMKEGKIILP